jgi:hypothetical protein
LQSRPTQGISVVVVPEALTPDLLGERLLRIGVLVAVAAVGFQTAAHLTNAFLLDSGVAGLDADVEGNAFTWASSVATFALAMAAFLHAAVFSERRREFSLLVGLGVLLSLDDVVQIHERLGLGVGEDLLGLPDYLAVRLWLVFYLPLLLLTGALLWLVAEALWSPAARMLRLGLALLVASIPVEIVGAATRWLEEEEGISLPNDLRLAVEEGLELGGWILAAAGLTSGFAVALMRYRPPEAAR